MNFAVQFHRKYERKNQIKKRANILTFEVGKCVTKAVKNNI